MANSKGSSRRPPAPGQAKKQAGPAKGAKKAAAGAKPEQPHRPIARPSVAQERPSRTTNNRTQLIIGGIAIVLIIAVIALGLVLNKRETAIQEDGYGASTNSIATAADGPVRVSAPPPPPPGDPISIDLFEDAMCPGCAQFEEQFGQQVNKAVDEGRLIVTVHMLDFLNSRSASGDYSTRAAAATICVAEHSGDLPGVYLAFKSRLFAPGTQPREDGESDLGNEQLAELATAAGASQRAADCIASGEGVADAAAAAQASSQSLSAATGGAAGTPYVLAAGVPVDREVDWLTKLLAGS